MSTRASTPMTIRASFSERGEPGWLGLTHTAEGGNTPPTLIVEGVPENVVELALICHDPDAPRPHGWTHWVVYGIPPTVTEIGPDNQFRTGPNGSGDYSYFGCRPPIGHGVHHYYFHLYALGTTVEGAPTREEFLDRYAGDILAQARWVGMYERGDS